MASASGFQAIPGSWEWPDDVRHSHRRPAAEAASPSGAKAEQQRDSESSSHSAGPKQESNQNAGSQRKEKHWKPRTCRICLDTVLPTYHPPAEDLPNMFQPGPKVTYESEDGYLISPCKCKGSSKYVHEGCLQRWRHSDPAYSKRNYYQCPTCGFKYRLSRLGWARLISSVGLQVALTLSVFLLSMFILGFIADPIIDFCLDPYGFFFSGFTSRSTPVYLEDLEEDSTWLAHFTKGFASLGLISFFKVMFASPIRFFFRSSSFGGTGRGTTGRDRLSNVTWIVILFGALTFIYGVWKIVRAWSRRTLEKAGERVMDVHGDDDDGDDD